VKKSKPKPDEGAAVDVFEVVGHHGVGHSVRLLGKKLHGPKLSQPRKKAAVAGAADVLMIATGYSDGKPKGYSIGGTC